MLRSSPPAPSLDPRLCNSLLASLSADGHLKLSGTVFGSMLDRNIGCTTLGFGVYLNWYCRDAELGETLGILDRLRARSMEKIDGSVVAALVADGLCRCSRVVDARKALGELRKRGCKPDFIAYQIVVEAFRGVGRVEDARQVLKEKRKLGVAPRMDDYEAFIVGLILEKRILEAKCLADTIIKGNFPVAGAVLDALIASVSCDYVESAFAFLQFMTEKGFLPSPKTVQCLTSSLARNKEAGKMWGVLRLLSANNYFSDVASYNAVVSALCEVGQVKEAYYVVKEMRANGLSPDIHSYNCLMEACCKEDLVRPAKRLWDEMFTYGCPGNLQTYNILIRKLSKSGEVQEAHGLFRHMLGKGILPDNVSYSALIKGMCRDGKTDDAFEIFKKSFEQDKQLASSTLRILISSLCQGGMTVTKSIQRVKLLQILYVALSFDMNPIALNVTGHFAAAIKIMQHLSSSELDMSTAHVILVKSLSELGEIKMAVDYLKEIIEKEPSKLKEISMELIHSLSFSLNMDPIMNLLEEMRRIGVDFETPWIDLPNEIKAQMLPSLR